MISRWMIILGMLLVLILSTGGMAAVKKPKAPPKPHHQVHASVNGRTLGTRLHSHHPHVYHRRHRHHRRRRHHHRHIPTSQPSDAHQSTPQTNMPQVP
jgi:hypothetical protein